MCMFIVLSLYEFYKLLYKKDGELAAKTEHMLNLQENIKLTEPFCPCFVFMAIFSKGAVGFLVPCNLNNCVPAADRNLRIIGKYLGWRFWTILLCLCIVWFTGVYIDGGKSLSGQFAFNQTVNRVVNSFHHKKPFGIMELHIGMQLHRVHNVRSCIVKGYYKGLMGEQEKIICEHCVFHNNYALLIAQRL